MASAPGERLVWVTSANNEAEGDLIQSLLSDAGVQAVVRRSQAFDVPDYLAAGQRDVLVGESQAELARTVLGETGRAASASSSPLVDAPLRVVAGTLIAVALVALVAWLGTVLIA